jgi:signal transduction histidine kinase/FixJ family two-component response regulator
MLDVRGGGGFWRSLCQKVISDRISAPVATFLALIGGWRLGRTGVGLPWSRQKGVVTEPDNPRYQAQKMEALGRLTGGVAHDFNNLLTVVLGNAAALRVSAEASGDANAARRAEMIERAAERGGRLAGQLLAYSGKQMLRPEALSVYRTLSGMSELLAQAAGERVRIRLDAEAGLWNCRADPGQLESAMLNLVLNARDAMPSGGSIAIDCRNHRVGRGEQGIPAHSLGEYVRIDVGDTGCGIPPELRDKVFEPFFTTKAPGQGSGLGLSQVYGFAGQSGGWVALESAVGTGTTVSLFLPRDGRHPPEAPTSPPDKGSDRGPDKGPDAAPTGRNQTVLVVEPDTDLRATTGDTLSRASYRPLAAADGSGALAHLVSDARIHLLLTEADLPGGVSGIELGRSACQVRPELRVLVTSTVSRASPHGDKRFEFLMKPYRPRDLVSVVGAVLTRDTFSVETEELLADARARSAVAVRRRLRLRGRRIGIHRRPGCGRTRSGWACCRSEPLDRARMRRSQPGSRRRSPRRFRVFAPFCASRRRRSRRWLKSRTGRASAGGGLIWIS